jgi:hypothetical protein
MIFVKENKALPVQLVPKESVDHEEEEGRQDPPVRQELREQRELDSEGQLESQEQQEQPDQEVLATLLIFTILLQMVYL